MKAILLFILSVFLSISTYSQSYQVKKSADGKRNSIRAIYNGRVDRHVPTEGDGTGDKIKGQLPKKVKNKYNQFVRKRQKFVQRRYNLKTAGGEPIKPGR